MTSERLDNAYSAEQWFHHASSIIGKYVAIWTMGAHPEEYRTLEELMTAYQGVKDWEVVVAINQDSDVGYVVPAEFNGSLRPMRGRKTLRLTRFDTPSRFEQIRKHGLYQVPGRLCFNTEVDGRFERKGIESIWDVPMGLLAQLNFSAQKALAYNESLLTDQLPLDYDILTPHEESPREYLRTKILSIGQQSGLLINVPPSYINLPETLIRNQSLRQ